MIGSWQERRERERVSYWVIDVDQEISAMDLEEMDSSVRFISVYHSIMNSTSKFMIEQIQVPLSLSLSLSLSFWFHSFPLNLFPFAKFSEGKLKMQNRWEKWKRF
jgi:hypothetical protein